MRRLSRLGRSRGFTLIELLLSVAVGSLVALAAGSVFLLSMQGGVEATRQARLTQELRAVADMLTQDLQRAGLPASLEGEEDADLRIYDDGDGDDTTRADCLLYAYDRDGDELLDEAGGEDERLGLRVRKGRLQVRTEGRSCNAEYDQWLTLGDGQVIFNEFAVEKIENAQALMITLSAHHATDNTLKRTLQMELQPRSPGLAIIVK